MKLLNLFNFFTRSGREEFAAVSLAVQAVSFLLTAGTLLLVPSSGEMDLAKSIVLVVVGLLMIPVSLGVFPAAARFKFVRLVVCRLFDCRHGGCVCLAPAVVGIYRVGNGGVFSTVP